MKDNTTQILATVEQLQKTLEQLISTVINETAVRKRVEELESRVLALEDEVQRLKQSQGGGTRSPWDTIRDNEWYQPYKWDPNPPPFGPGWPITWPITPSIPTFPTLPIDACPKCHLKLDRVMGYCCPDLDCPTGMGPVRCSTDSG